MTVERVSVAVIGGAVMGSATAYFLRERLGHTGRVAVLEKDRSYAFAASARSTSGYRQQFSTPVNIALSRWSAAFLSEANELLSDGDETAGIPISHAGYLYLGGASQVAMFEANHELQRSFGVDVALLGQEALAHRFPWLNVDDVAIGSLGLSGEGWFDGYLLLSAFRRRACAAGAEYLYAAADTLARDGAGFRIRCTDGTQLLADRLVLTAGTATPDLAKQLGVVLPVTPAKQTVFAFSSPFQAAAMPYVFTPDGLFVRPEGGDYIGGMGIGESEADPNDFEADADLFDTVVWPALAHRIEPFAEARFRSAWAGHYDMSRFDHNPFIGPVEDVPGLFVACGFSGHGMMQSPGVGLTLAEHICFGDARTLNLTDLAHNRIAANRPVFERIQY